MKNIFILLFLILLTNSCSVNKTIYVGDLLTNCNGGSSKKCLKIKEAITDDWTLIKNNIKGFDYKEGYIYKLDVNAKKTNNLSAGEPEYKYSLVNLIYQEKTRSTEEQMNFKGTWKVSKLIGIDNLIKSPTILIDFESKRINGNAGCNSYGTNFNIEGDHIKFGLPIATKMMCENMNIEKTFFTCLHKTAYYKIIDNKLKLYSKEGEEQMTCNKIDQ